MKVSFSKKFDKQLDAISDKKARAAIAIAIDKIINTDTLNEIPNLKKLKGHSNAFRIRIGVYRIGFYFVNGEIFISTVAHRREIYRNFP